MVKAEKAASHIDNEEEKLFVLEDTNIQMIAQQQMQSMFKSRSERVIPKPSNVPGPGAYDLAFNYRPGKSPSRVTVFEHNLVTERTAPSIPTDSLGYKCTSDNKIEKVRPKVTNGPVPGTYNLRTEVLQDRGITWTTHTTISRKEDDIVGPGPGMYNATVSVRAKAPTSCFNSGFDRFNPKKIKKSHNPGPGDYHTEVRLHRQQSEGHFNSKSIRFPIDKCSNLGPGAYELCKNSLSNNKMSDLMRVGADRKTIFSTIQNKNPGPGEYVARDGMTFELQKVLLRKHNISQFANSRRELFEPKGVEEPGPGAYEPALPKSSSKGNIGYNKVEVVNLK